MDVKVEVEGGGRELARSDKREGTGGRRRGLGRVGRGSAKGSYPGRVHGYVGRL